jgi:hypothetical protein
MKNINKERLAELGKMDKLSQSEREELEELKTELENEVTKPYVPDTEVADVPKPTTSIPKELTEPELAMNPEEKVTFTKAGLLQMLREIRSDERLKPSKTHDTEWHEKEEGKKRSHTATIRLWHPNQDEPAGVIMDYRRLRIEKDPDTGKRTREIYEMDILYSDGKIKKVTVPIEEFINLNEVETCAIVEIREKEYQMSEGFTNKSVTRIEDGIETVFDEKTGKKVPLLVTRDDGVAVLKRGNGEQIVIKLSKLNI